MEFFTVIPEILHLAPILPAKKFRPDILVNAAKDYAHVKNSPEFGTRKYTNPAKCVGIYEYARYGWVLTTWQDFVIETNGDKVSFNWETPVAQDKLTNGDMTTQMIDHHSKNQYADYIGGIPESLDTVVKINSPWRCIIPDGYFLMQGPLPHTNERRFTTATGFLSNDFGITQMNVQLFWHVLNGRTVVKAGTPIAHYMLIPKDQPDMSVGVASEEFIAKSKAAQLEMTRRNITDHKESKCVFAKILKG